MTFVGAVRGLSGYDPDRARALAPQVSLHIYRTCCVLVEGKWQACAWSGGAGVPNDVCYGYDRNLVKAFQEAAGFEADAITGAYGPATRGALIFYGVRNPPPALFGRGTTAYVPPSSAAVEPPPSEEPAPQAASPRPVAPGVIVGGVLGGIAATGLALWWVAARRRHR